MVSPFRTVILSVERSASSPFISSPSCLEEWRTGSGGIGPYPLELSRQLQLSHYPLNGLLGCNITDLPDRENV